MCFISVRSHVFLHVCIWKASRIWDVFFDSALPYCLATEHLAELETLFQLGWGQAESSQNLLVSTSWPWSHRHPQLCTPVISVPGGWRAGTVTHWAVSLAHSHTCAWTFVDMRSCGRAALCHCSNILSGLERILCKFIQRTEWSKGKSNQIRVEFRTEKEKRLEGSLWRHNYTLYLENSKRDAERFDLGTESCVSKLKSHSQFHSWLLDPQWNESLGGGGPFRGKACLAEVDTRRGLWRWEPAVVLAS